MISCVNSVGINLNTASKSLLSYVSELGKNGRKHCELQVEQKMVLSRPEKDLKKSTKIREKPINKGSFVRIKMLKSVG